MICTLLLTSYQSAHCFGQFIAAAFAIPYLNALHVAGYSPHPAPNSAHTRQRLRDEFICMILYIFGICMIKVSFAITLLRIMVERRQIIIVKILIAAIVGMTISFFVVTILTCTPISYFWTRATDPYAIAQFLGVPDPGVDGLVPKGSCRPPLTYGMPAMYSQVCLTIAVDFALGLVLPFLMLRNLRMRGSLKVTAFTLLALGAIPSIASIIRLCYAWTFASENALDNAQPLFVWSNVEFAWCQVGTALTTLRPLANKFGFLTDTPSRRSPAFSTRRFGARLRNLMSRTAPENRLQTGNAAGTQATSWGRDLAGQINHVGNDEITQTTEMSSKFEWDDFTQKSGYTVDIESLRSPASAHGREQ